MPIYPRPFITVGFSARQVDAVTGVVAPDGALDLESAPRLRRTLSQVADEGCTQIVVDLSRVAFIDSTALAVLVGVKRRLGADGTLAVAAADQQALKLFELTGLDRTIQVFSTTEAAIATLTGSSERASGSATTPSGGLPLTRDAAIALGIAATAMPFADSPEDQVERWLHALLLHGQAGAALASLGFREDTSHPEPTPSASLQGQRDDHEVVGSVTARAHRIATDDGASRTGTAHLVLAVIDCYGSDCDRVLARNGVDRDELRALLEAEPPQPPG